jgi:hypothetical protein
MRFLHWRVFLGLFWLALACVLFFRTMIFSEEQLANYREANLVFGGWLALVLAGWNFARWLLAESLRQQRATPQPNPIRTRLRRTREAEYHPEFDFQKDQRQIDTDKGMDRT